MQDLVIKNVKTAEYKETNLNQFYDPDGVHKRQFGFLKSNVTAP